MKQAATMVAAAVLVVITGGEAPLRRRFPSSAARGRALDSQGTLLDTAATFLTPPPPPPLFGDLSATGGGFLDAPAAPFVDLGGARVFQAGEEAPAFSGVDHELIVGHSEKFDVPAARPRARASFKSDSHSPDGSGNYEFSYQVLDEQSGNDYGHQESRKDEEARGSYHVLLPDGRRQVVDYEADHHGYRPVVHYEDSNRGGYPGSKKAGRF